MTPQRQFETDILPTSAGELAITFLGHGSLFMTFNGKTIHVDPFGEVAEYSTLPKASFVLVTHEHGDHLDPKALAAIRTPATLVVVNAAGAQQASGGTVMRNGDRQIMAGIPVEAVPAYNLVNKRPDGQPFHPKGIGNGYILTFGEKRVAFLPMNLPYTMTPEMVADAARAFRPHILYPYHYGNTDTSKLVELLKDEKDIEVRIRKLA